jgi:tRNA(Arg) A34 adenosine deaminase TadA
MQNKDAMRTIDEDRAFLLRAVELSRLGMESGEGGPFGAVVVRDGRVVGEGNNRVLCRCDPTAHAEVEAIRDAGKRLENFDLSGSVIYASSEPCPMCLAAIYWARIDRIVYANSIEDAAAIGFDDADFYEQLGKGVADRRVRQERIVLPEARAVFEAWAKKSDRVAY